MHLIFVSTILESIKSTPSSLDAMPSVQELLLRVLARLKGASLTPIILDASAPTMSVGPSAAPVDLPKVHVGPTSAPVDPPTVSAIPF